MTKCSFTQINRSSFNLQGCGGSCIPVCAKALASLHVLELAKGVSVAVLGVPLAWLSRIALPCSVPVTCGIRDNGVSHACKMMTNTALGGPRRTALQHHSRVRHEGKYLTQAK